MTQTLFQKLSRLILLTFTIATVSCQTKTQADLIVRNARIYMVDSSFGVAEAMAIKDGKILAIGSGSEIETDYQSDSLVDAGGNYIYPGFIDAHAHFVNYGFSLQTVDLNGTKSWLECLERIDQFVKRQQLAPGDWIIGRGWDQNDWDSKQFPRKDSLDRLYPQNPVLLRRIDGHAAIVNEAALSLSRIRPNMKIVGGDIETENGKLTGLLVDNAIGLVSVNIPSPTTERTASALLEAQRNCFAKGLTTIDDCGLDYPVVLQIDSLQKAGKLKMRIYAMLSDDPQNFSFIFDRGKIKTDRLQVRAFKVYADGALGSRGACLLEPYSDRHNHYGFLLSNKSHFDSVAAILSQRDLQMCTHAIGDSGNRQILNTYARFLEGKNDRRWRIEHAQVVNEADFRMFGQYSIIPSVQPTHATSDMYWANERLGDAREKGAYAFKQLMQQNGWIALGTDFPVEDIDPLKTFFAAVFRKDSKGWPEQGYQTENALTRDDAIRGMTIWAARSNFEEDEKGSLEVGKLADFIILDKDILTASEKEILSTRVLQTFINGENVYKLNQ